MLTRNLRLRYALCASVLSISCGLVSAQTQVVYLNFDRVNVVTDRDYTQVERDDIQTRMEADYALFDFQFVQAEPTAGDYTTLFFNDGPAFGVAEGIDFRNQNRNDRARIQTTPGEVQAEDYIAFTANVASHELGHILGLRHYDSLGPIGSGFEADPSFLFGARADFPTYSGPFEADESVFHLMETGITQVMATFPPLKYFGPREAVKLSFNERGTTLSEASLSPVLNSPFVQTPRQIELFDLDVPNTVEQGDLSRQLFDVEAVAVTGSISSALQKDYFAFEGNAGDLINIEAISELLGPDLLGGNGRYTEVIDTNLALFDANGDPVEYFGQNATNDDEFEGSFDSFILDLVLPEDGTYYIEVKTFASFDVGAYELYLTRFEAEQTPEGDFNLDGVVDAADYTVWRDTNGSTTDLRADADFNGKVDELDREKWEDNLGREATLVVTPAHLATGIGPRGESLSSLALSVPEPTAALLALIGLAGCGVCRR